MYSMDVSTYGVVGVTVDTINYTQFINSIEMCACIGRLTDSNSNRKKE